ncbi:hypothetical protein HJFPF1_00391 [Paramyrothecium foliicola]|nr:hypothetical protein HJFPF1_00391 [Paramyrothecium foliicola]
MPRSRAEERRRRVAAAEAALSPQALLEERQAWGKKHPSLHTSLTNQQRATIKRWFVEFLADRHPDIDANATFFTPGSPAPKLAIFHESFWENHEQNQPKSLEGYMNILLSLMEDEGEHSRMNHFRREVKNYITNDISQREGLSTMMKLKPVAHLEDINLMVNKLYDPEFLETFVDMRQVLNFTLLCALTIDVCGRGSGLARNPNQAEHMCLRWGDVSFTSFQSVDNDNFDIQMIITIRWGKSMSLDESRYRCYTFSQLLPAEMALQDSLRLMINLALMDGIFGNDIKTWKDLKSFRLPASIAETGRRVPMKESVLKLPVLRQMSKHHLTDVPIATTEMQAIFRELGRFCGFKYHLTLYAIRRGVALVFDTKRDTDARQFMMDHGHTSDDRNTSYRSGVFTINWPARFRGVEERSVLGLSRIAVNRSDSAPTKISAEGQQLVLATDDVRQATAKMETARSAILQTFSSIEAASRANDSLAQIFKDAQASRRSIIDRLEKARFKFEYDNHFRQMNVDSSSVGMTLPGNTGPLSPETPTQDCQSLLRVSAIAPSSGAQINSTGQSPNDQVAGPTPQPHHTSRRFSHEDPNSSNVIMKIARQHAVISPEDIDDSEMSDDEGPIPLPAHRERLGNSSPTLPNGPIKRLHGLPELTTGKGLDRIERKGASAFNNIIEEIKETCDNDEAISLVLQRWFQVTQPIEGTSHHLKEVREISPTQAAHDQLSHQLISAELRLQTGPEPEPKPAQKRQGPDTHHQKRKLRRRVFIDSDDEL